MAQKSHDAFHSKAKTMTANRGHFHQAVFCPDGEFMGTEPRDAGLLSQKWLNNCRTFIENLGPVFDSSWGGSLSHVRTKFTEASGVAIATFFVRDHVVTSMLLLTGDLAEAEHQATQMFVDSLRRVDFVRAAATSPKPFEFVFSITQRPLVVIVPWNAPGMTDVEHQMISELTLHFSGAYFGSSI